MLSEPKPWDGWYLDGGIRLNAPLKPAIALGADAIAVVATHPEIDTATAPPTASPPPDVYDVVVRLMDATLVDPMIEDLRTLIKINTLIDSTERVTATGRTQKAIPFLAIAPPARATLGQLAEQIFQNQRERWQGVVPTLRQGELRMLGRVVGGGGPRRGDLFSYLYFDPEFIEAVHRTRPQQRRGGLRGLAARPAAVADRFAATAYHAVRRKRCRSIRAS